MIQKLSADFSAELKAKQDAYDVSNIHVKAATRELAEQRKQIDFWKQQHGDFDRVLQRVRTLKRRYPMRMLTGQDVLKQMAMLLNQDLEIQPLCTEAHSQQPQLWIIRISHRI